MFFFSVHHGSREYSVADMTICWEPWGNHDVDVTINMTDGTFFFCPRDPTHAILATPTDPSLLLRAPRVLFNLQTDPYPFPTPTPLPLISFSDVFKSIVSPFVTTIPRFRVPLTGVNMNHEPLSSSKLPHPHPQPTPLVGIGKNSPMASSRVRKRS
jgi:hypothetical protein